MKRKRSLAPMPYTSLWALGSYCDSTEIVWQFEKETYGHGPFAWCEVYDIEKAVDMICEYPQSVMNLDRLRFVYNNNRFPGSNMPGLYDPLYEIGYMHHMPYGRTRDESQLMEDNFPEFAERMKRRWGRMMAELEDPEAYPVFCYDGHGPDKYCFNFTGEFDLAKANRCIEKLMDRFPSHVGLLYSFYTPDKSNKALELAYVDYGIRAWKHGFTANDRWNGQRAYINALFASNPAIRDCLKRHHTYDDQIARKQPNSAVVLDTQHASWRDYLVLTNGLKRGYRFCNMKIKFDVLSYYPDNELVIQWEPYSWGREIFKYSPTDKLWHFVRSEEKKQV